MQKIKFKLKLKKYFNIKKIYKLINLYKKKIIGFLEKNNIANLLL